MRHTIESYNLTSCTLRAEGSSSSLIQHMIAIGVQQWGYAANSTKITFPISFNQTPVVFIQNPKDNTTTVAPVVDLWAPKDLSSTTVTLGHYGTQWNRLVMYWFCFGQQWGVSKTYPINFETFCAKVYKRGSATNDTYETIMTTVTTDLNKIGVSSVEYHFIAIGI